MSSRLWRLGIKRKERRKNIQFLCWCCMDYIMCNMGSSCLIQANGKIRSVLRQRIITTSMREKFVLVSRCEEWKGIIMRNHNWSCTQCISLLFEYLHFTCRRISLSKMIIYSASFFTECLIFMNIPFYLASFMLLYSFIAIEHALKTIL